MRENTMTYGCPEFEINTEQELLKCLNNLRRQCIEVSGSDTIVDKCLEFWLFFNNNTNNLQVPDVIFDPTVLDELIISFCWNNKEEWMCCEILEDGSLQFNYTNRISREQLGEDYHPGKNKFPLKAFELLSRFTKE